MSSRSDLHFYQVTSKYDNKSNSNARRGNNSKSKKKPKLSFLYVVWSCSSLLPGIIKYSKRCLTHIKDTKSKHNYYQKKGDNVKSKKGRDRTHCHTPVYISTKYHQNIPKGIRVTEQTLNQFQTKQRVITPKVRKPEMSFLYTTSFLLLFYISTKYHQIIPKGFWVTADTKSISNKTKRGKSKRKKARVVIHAWNMSFCPVLHFYWVS